MHQAWYEASFQSATTHLVQTMFQIYIGIVMLRFLLPLVRANYFNPVCQFIIKLTDPLLRPMRRVIPTLGRIDAAALVLMLILQLLEGWLQTLIYGQSVPFLSLLAYAALRLVQMLLFLYLVMIIVNAILSWFAHSVNHPVVPLLNQLTEPVLQPIRRVVPLIAGIDISPLIALIAIQFLIRLIG